MTFLGNWVRCTGQRQVIVWMRLTLAEAMQVTPPSESKDQYGNGWQHTLVDGDGNVLGIEAPIAGARAWRLTPAGWRRLRLEADAFIEADANHRNVEKSADGSAPERPCT